MVSLGNSTSITSQVTNTGAPNIFTWTAPSSGKVVVNTVGSNFDTIMSISGPGFSDFNDDAFGFFGPSELSELVFDVTAGATYQIEVDGFGSSVGQVILNLDFASSTLTGTSGANTLYGGNGNDYIAAGDGDDKVFGSEGVNILNGGAGRDTIYGGSKRDVIRAGSGNDLIYASEGRNDVYAGSGNDTTYSGSGNDYLIGGEGNDTFYLGGGKDEIVLTKFNNGTDTIINFQNGQTRFALGSTDFTNFGDGLKFTDLTVTQSGSHTLIKFGTQTLASLQNVQSSVIDASDFYSIVSNA